MKIFSKINLGSIQYCLELYLSEFFYKLLFNKEIDIKRFILPNQS